MRRSIGSVRLVLIFLLLIALPIIITGINCGVAPERDVNLASGSPQAAAASQPTVATPPAMILPGETKFPGDDAAGETKQKDGRPDLNLPPSDEAGNSHPPEVNGASSPTYPRALTQREMEGFCPRTQELSPKRRIVHERVYYDKAGRYDLVGESIIDILTDAQDNSHWKFKDINNVVNDEIFIVNDIQYTQVGNKWEQSPFGAGSSSRSQTNGLEGIDDRSGKLCAFRIDQLSDVSDHGMQMLNGAMLRHVSAVDLRPYRGQQGHLIKLDFWFDSRGRIVQFKNTRFSPPVDSYPVKPARRVETVTIFSRPVGIITIKAPDVSVHIETR